ncbi:hypothetical protein, conserved in T. vivax [Trypanosoma vivax Y486]|uniref:Uncharacterized protein n=1 Tax=Trypanosoma vivax (strain Y486) TaxID=1055687 RepID=F9WRM2_TRYVY|nr:hypothetical protein, conserved in T. vivax [Trypanosoma vivax Y486]|eukprot:CCD20206.1 hypothetical protein, conserved in T. vivax [Trypanosoma vivax Y486]
MSALEEKECVAQLRRHLLQETQVYAEGLSDMVKKFANETRTKQLSHVVCFADNDGPQSPLVDLSAPGVRGCLDTSDNLTDSYESAVALLRQRVDAMCLGSRCHSGGCAIRSVSVFGRPRDCTLTSEDRLRYMHGGEDTYARLLRVKALKTKPDLIWTGGCHSRHGNMQKLLNEMDRLVRGRGLWCMEDEDVEGRSATKEFPNNDSPTVDEDDQSTLVDDEEDADTDADASTGDISENKGEAGQRDGAPTVEGIREDRMLSERLASELEKVSARKASGFPAQKAQPAATTHAPTADTHKDGTQVSSSLEQRASVHTTGGVRPSITTENADEKRSTSADQATTLHDAVQIHALALSSPCRTIFLTFILFSVYAL